MIEGSGSRSGARSIPLTIIDPDLDPGGQKHWFRIRNIDFDNTRILILFVDDRLVHKLVDDVRYQASLRLKEDIQAGNATKLAVNKDDNEATKAVKRARETYIVNAAKFSSIVTEQQLAHDFTEEDLGTEETHQILQHKIWYYYSIYYYSVGGINIRHFNNARPFWNK